MLIAITVNYLLGMAIENTNGIYRKIILIVGVITNLSILGFYKYFDFAVTNFNLALVRFDYPEIPFEKVLLPLGISFYTFQNISYILDVYRSEIKAQYNWVKYTLYVTFFAHLVAGPVVRYSHISAEIDSRETNYILFYEGIKRLIIGLGKKILIANPVGYVAEAVFDTHSESGFLVYWVGIICYAIQIYFDFSGYSDMAIGMARMLGFFFHENFNMPYLATSVTDFWRRWHISLSTWFRDYVYIPLGGNRGGKIDQLKNIFIVFLLTGLWHGASWNFILWGVIHGIFMVIERVWLLKKLEKIPVIFSRVYLLTFILITWILFNAKDIHAAGDYLFKMFDLSSIGNLSLLTLVDTQVKIALIVGVLMSFGLHIKVWNKLKEQLNNTALYAFQSAFYISVLILCIIFVSIESYNPFIYFRF
ncbi:MAG: MBOAT family protein [Opitutaceae bacterium]|nr:MBOAT family protein [Cytophagales bacterium]